MPCSAASTLKPTASIPLLSGLPSSLAQPLRIFAQQVLAQVQAAAGTTGVNVIPQQYALVAGSTLPPIASVSNCTVTLDTSTGLFGAGSYKIAITGTPAKVTFASQSAWPLHPGWQWLASFFQQGSAAISGELTVTTAGGTAYTTDFTTTTGSLSTGRLYDALNLGADTSTAFGLSFTFTGGTGDTVWLNGLMLEPYFGRPIQPSPFISTSPPLTLDNNPDGTYAKILASRTSGNIAYNYRGTWSSTASYLIGDEVVYGQSYWLAVAASTDSAPSTSSTNWQVIGSYSGYEGAWSSTAAYIAGAEVTYSGNYWVCVTANTNSAPSASNANWQLAGPASAADISYTDGSTVESLQPAEAGADVTSTHTAADTSAVDGTAAQTVAQGAVRANATIDSTNVVVASGIDLSRAYTNKTLTNIADSTPYFRVQSWGLPQTFTTGSWFNLGTWTFATPPGVFRAEITAGAGYNTNGNQQTLTKIYARSANYGAGGTTAPNISGLSWQEDGGSPFIQAMKLVASGSNTTGTGNTWDLYVQVFNFAAGQFIFLPDSNNSFSFNGAAASDPGAASATVVVGTGGAYFNTTNGAGIDGLRDGLTYYRMPAANMDGNRRGLIDFSQAGHLNKNLDYVADGGARFGVVNKGGLGGVVEWDTNYRAIIDLSQSAHLNKNLGYIADGGGRYASLNGSAYGINSVDGSNRVNTIAGAVSPLGSVATGASDISIAYSSTSSSITLSWYGPGGPGTSGTLNRMDGSQTTVAAGSVTVTGLSASTQYYAAAYYDESAQGLAFVTGQSGAVGSPAILYPSESSAVAWQANLQARVNLGWVPVATAASGTTGGGNGSSGCCLRGSQLIELANGVMRFADELTTGDLLTSPEGPTRITQLRFETWAEWYVIEFNDGRILEVAPDHRFMDPAGTQIHARDLKLTQIVEARNCYLSVARLELCTDRDIKVGIEVEEPHVYYVDGVLSHNKVYC